MSKTRTLRRMWVTLSQRCNKVFVLIVLLILLIGQIMFNSVNLDLPESPPALPPTCFWSAESKRILGYWSSKCDPEEEELRLAKYLHPPKPDAASLLILQRYFSTPSGIERGAKHFSLLIQRQIHAIQRKSCDHPNCMCGLHDAGAGFAYQLHHRVPCLIMSYVTGMPLIHTVDHDGWYYLHPWSHVFTLLGTNCTPGNNTFVWNWHNDGCSGEVSKCHNVLYNKVTYTAIPYPLSFGAKLDDALVPFVDKLFPGDWTHLAKFLWVTGQFTKYAMRLNSTFEQELANLMKQAGFGKSIKIVGLQVRSTDKVTEYSDSVHPLSLYFHHAEEYFLKLEKNSTKIPRIVYLSSDNSSLVSVARERYPSWKIIGFPATFSEKWETRRHDVFEIIRDIILLSECDHVVCGFSSNVCRLILEIQSWKYYRFNPGNISNNGSSRLKSLDGAYIYNLWGIKF
ncbi:Alpha-(1,6)-fucosyltransferase [Folsomia candida]|uniref:Alpha-(1,6)-fucosyltransferase n=1 Tax=Folsomia candida TaxID=158441 RepID=A0A226DB42_FOLCA|nr:Alpha-(1,6)-fucosyltransferase [Folsomia candida]